MSKEANNYITVKKAGKKGKGLFAFKDFRKGEKIYSYKKGKIVRATDINRLTKKEQDHLDKIGRDVYEVIRFPAHYVNHSCNPNIIEKKRVAYALRNINKGEEITIDYNKMAYLEHPFPCYCGSKNCKGFVYGVIGKKKKTKDRQPKARF